MAKKRQTNQTEIATLDIDTQEGRTEIIHRALDGDPSMKEQFCQVVKSYPSEVLSRTNFSQGIRNLWEEAIFPKNYGNRAAMELKVKEMRQQLGGPNPSELEKLLIERIITCWIALFHAEGFRASYYQREDGWEFGKAALHDRRVERAQALYYKSIKALAQIRRLQIPILTQINLYPSKRVVPEEICRTGSK